MLLSFNTSQSTKEGDENVSFCHKETSALSKSSHFNYSSSSFNACELRQQWSISPTFYENNLRQYSCAKKSLNLKCEYKKALRETFVQKRSA